MRVRGDIVDSLFIQARQRAAEARGSRSAGRVGSGGEEPGEEPSFTRLLEDKVQEVDQAIRESERAAADLVVGRSGDIHGTMLALEQAELEFRLLAAVRNKALDAYHQIMRMNV